MTEQGNIDVNHRPVIANEDGSHSTIFSMTVPIGSDGKSRPWGNKDVTGYALVPSIANGKFLTLDGKKPDTKNRQQMQDLEDAATAQYDRTREHLGIFKTEAALNDYANATHDYMPDGTDRKVFISPRGAQ